MKEDTIATTFVDVNFVKLDHRVVCCLIING